MLYAGEKKEKSNENKFPNFINKYLLSGRSVKTTNAHKITTKVHTNQVKRHNAQELYTFIKSLMSRRTITDFYFILKYIQ